jgi:hypothetical protein
MKFEIYTRPINPYKEKVSNSHTHYPKAVVMNLTEKVFDELEFDYNLWDRLNSIAQIDDGMGYSISKYEDAWVKNSRSLKSFKLMLQSLSLKKQSKNIKEIEKIISICDTALENGHWVVFDF